MKLHLRLISLIGVVVPRRLRADWRQEWEAELRYREMLLADWDKLNWRTKLDLLRRSLGAFRDALLLQPQRLEDEMFQDLRYGMRMLLTRPGFSAVIVMILALGIGGTSAIFSVVNAVLLRPLPYPAPNRLMMIFSASEREGLAEKTGPVYGPDFVEWRDQSSTCEQMAAFTGTWPSNLTGGAEPQRARIARVTDGLFATIGVRPILGRTFLPDETGRPLLGSDSKVSGPIAVVLGYGLWQRSFGSDPSVVGRAIKIEGDVCTVIGVMPDGFKFPDEADAWMPVALSAKRDNAFLRVVARLRARATQQQAQAELATIAGRIEQEFPRTNKGIGVNVVPLSEYIVGEVRSSLLIFLGAVSFVLLIACANVANLLLARAATRQKEMAIRSALGAGRLRIVRQLLTESLMLAVLGGGLGLLLAFAILNVLLAFAPQQIPRLNSIGIDGWVLGFTLLLSVLTGILFGVAPAVQASRPDLNEALKEGGVRARRGTARNRLRGLLVIAEVSLALVLLIGAGLLMKSFSQLRETRLGFNPDHVLCAAVTLPQAAYPTTEKIKAYYQQALDRLVARREVRAAGVVSSLPLGKTGARIRGDLVVEGEAAERPNVSASKLAVSADYFRALGIPLLKGRAFDEHDNQGSTGVLIVSEALARTLWPNQDPIGKRLNIGFRGETWREVVGVAGDVRQEELGAPPAAAIYQPFLQVADNRPWMLGEMTFVVNTAVDAQEFVSDLRGELGEVDKDLPLHDVAVMQQVISDKVADPRFYTFLLGSFSVVALILAAAGIYGVVSYSVTQRTHEIGIRLALGAQGGDVLRSVVGHSMGLTMTGLAIGLAAALALTKVLSGFLYQVSVTDTTTFVMLSGLLAGVAFVACFIPARRATRVDPLVALRHE